MRKAVTMESIPVRTSPEETYRQLLFIDDFIVKANKRRVFRHTLIYLAISVVVFGLFLFTNSNTVVAWMVTVLLFWIGFAFFMLYLWWKKYRRRHVTLVKLANLGANDGKSISLLFDSDKITLVINGERKTVDWANLKAYLEEPGTIYLFNDYPYQAWSFSDAEIGATAVQHLKLLARQKLPLLNDNQ